MNRIGLTKGGLTWVAVLPLFVLALVVLGLPTTLRAQVTATLTGTVEDQSGGVIPAAQVTLTNEATKFATVDTTNGAGLYAFPSLTPGTYDIRASAKGFKAKEVTGVVLNAGDVKTVPALDLTVGAESQTVTVSATSEMIPVENGQRTDVLSRTDIDNMALEGRDTTELMMSLPGAVTASTNLTTTAPSYGDLNVTVDQAAVGSGVYLSGSIYRGGTSIEVDGAQTIDIGDMASSLVVIDPEMTEQVSVSTSNMSADQAFGPVVVSTISRSGSSNYHGEGYFDARNNVLNANGWQQNQAHTKLGPQSYYYPGGSFGGPVPGTHKKLLFWGGYEKWLQNQGNANVLTSYIPSPEMMQGDFSTDNTDNTGICPHGFILGTQSSGSPGAPFGGYGGSGWCSDLSTTVLANGNATATLPTLTPTGTYTNGSGSSAVTYNTDAGQKFPAGFLDPGAAALAKIWPKANITPSASVCNGCNYYQPIVNVDNGWIWRARVDYLLGDNTKIYGSYEQAFSEGFAQGNGAHLYWTPGNAIPFPGGGEIQNNYGKVMAGHIVHNFNATTTNDLLAAWAFGSYPFTTPDPAAATRVTNGYTYGKVFNTPSANIPAYNSNGNIPDFSQASIFENPVGKYAVKKEAPQFGDTLTKVWGTHTIKIGGFTQTTDNYQSSFSYDEDGIMSFSASQHPNLLSTTNLGVPVESSGNIGSPFNPVAQFVSGMLSGYTENNGAPIGDVAQQSTAAFVDDTWKAARRLTLELGIRIEHVGHWYDRDHVGLAVFYPGRVLNDYFTGKYAPGYYWHAIDAGVPLSGQPNRFAYPDARFGMSYDVFGHGNTIVRGGWGVYRYVTQVNTIANGEAQGTAAGVLSYNQPGSTILEMQNVHNQAYVACPSALVAPPCGAQGGQTGLDASDYGQPMTQAYNLTIDQRLPWNSQLEAAYVGNMTSQLVDGGEDISGSSYTELTNVNKTPIGALFLPDPVTGKTATNPENVTENPNLSTMSATPTGNKLADYHPLGLAYGTNSTYVLENSAYANYNGLQVAWIKTTGRLTFNLNGTWSKMLGTTIQQDPYTEKGNYGPTAEDRPFVFNETYAYNSGTLHTGNSLLNGLGGGWTITGITTWQKGSYIPAVGSVNFGLGEQYTGLPADTTGASCTKGGTVPYNVNNCSLAADTGITAGIGDPTYFGTDEGIPIRPVLTCNPNNGLSGTKSIAGQPSVQILNGKCFNAPAVGSQGGQAYPYMSQTPYFSNDLALYRTFHVYEKQQVQFRVSAFDWLNHSLLAFNGGTPTTVNYNVDYGSKTITPNFNTGSSGTGAFGVMTVRSALPYARVLELDVKYSF
jgi:Carboxypeptidase regulatory-like domain